MKKRRMTPKEAASFFSVHVGTLRRWEREGKIEAERTPGGDRRYLVPTGEEVSICYCRVSSWKQKDDLRRQIAFTLEKCPQGTELVKDIGSGLNFKRRGLLSILGRAINGDRVTLYVAHKDRLARFGFELIRWIIEQSGGKVVVFDERKASPEQELTQDLLTILHVFSCRLHGLRGYRKQVDKALSNEGTEKDLQALD